jgi:hypothetical protein
MDRTERDDACAVDSCGKVVNRLLLAGCRGNIQDPGCLDAALIHLAEQAFCGSVGYWSEAATVMPELLQSSPGNPGRKTMCVAINTGTHLTVSLHLSISVCLDKSMFSPYMIP